MQSKYSLENLENILILDTLTLLVFSSEKVESLFFRNYNFFYCGFLKIIQNLKDFEQQLTHGNRVTSEDEEF